jgi:Fe-Mn family superoxide dismutase
MPFQLPPLPYPYDALAPHISAETLQFHHDKHHAGYITKLNEMVGDDAALAGKGLDDLVRQARGTVFDQAAQAWNHDFYWRSMRPQGGGAPFGAVAAAIDRSFGSFAAFKERFSAAAAGHFGSGWAWLVQEGDRLQVLDTHDAGNPLPRQLKPILTCDVWEHAYYIDYRNERPKYIEAWWNLVNWEHANAQLAR